MKNIGDYYKYEPNYKVDNKRQSDGVSTIISQLEWKSMQRKNEDI